MARRLIVIITVLALMLSVRIIGYSYLVIEPTSEVHLSASPSVFTAGQTINLHSETFRPFDKPWGWCIAEEEGSIETAWWCDYFLVERCPFIDLAGSDGFYSSLDTGCEYPNYEPDYLDLVGADHEPGMTLQNTIYDSYALHAYIGLTLQDYLDWRDFGGDPQYYYNAALHVSLGYDAVAVHAAPSVTVSLTSDRSSVQVGDPPVTVSATVAPSEYQNLLVWSGAGTTNSGNSSQRIVPTTASGQFVVTATVQGPLINGSSRSLTIEVRPVAVQLRLMGRIGKEQTWSEPVALPTVAHVPLGQYVEFALVDQNGASVPARFSVESCVSQDPSNCTFTSKPEAGALFEKYVAFAYRSQQNDKVRLQTVHLGIQRVRVTPNDAGIPATSFQIAAEAPANIGAALGTVEDPRVIAAAHAYGVPPNFVKAVMEQEGAGLYGAMNYRYEPLAKYGEGVISRGKNLRNEHGTPAKPSPYELYHFATQADALNNPGLSEGSGVSGNSGNDRTLHRSSAVSPRLFVQCGPNQTPRALTSSAADMLVWASEILRCNDRVMHWTNPKGASPAQIAANRARYAEIVNGDDFTAQTSLAASYGYMQMLYVAAIDGKWAGVAGGAKNPSYLFDTAANAAIGGGTTGVGTSKLRRLYRRSASAGADSPDGRWATPVEFMESFRPAFKSYNGTGPQADEYAGLVIDKIVPNRQKPPKQNLFWPNFWPQASRPLF